MSLGYWLAAAVVAGIAAVVLARTVQRRRFALGRQPIPLDDIARELQPTVSPEVVREVWTKVGAAYGIDPMLIKSDDNLKRFSAIDSWDLGHGGEKLDNWLRAKNLETSPHVETMRDLALWVQSGEKV